MEFNEYASRAEAVIDPAQEQDRQQVPLADPSGTRKRTRYVDYESWKGLLDDAKTRLPYLAIFGRRVPK